MLPCAGCAYRREAPGSAHLSCAYKWDEPGLRSVLVGAHITEKTAQWFIFPFNYDPTWGPDACPARAEGKVPPETLRAETPMSTLVAILGRRLLQ